jgi:hypothetical protein
MEDKKPKYGFTLTLTHRLPEEQEFIYSVEGNVWDASFDDVVEMFRAVSLAAGFQPSTIKEYLGDD